MITLAWVNFLNWLIIIKYFLISNYKEFVITVSNEMIEKENSIKSRLEQSEIDIRPESINRTLQMAGSMKPEEIRESRRKSLEAERGNLNSLLFEIQSTRANINLNLQKANEMVEKLRTKLEKDIDESFLKDDNEHPFP